MNKIVVLLLAIPLLSLATTGTVIADSSPALTIPQWAQIMNLRPTPGIGCWTASFPSLSWITAACGDVSGYRQVPLNMGGQSGDKPANSINYAMTAATGSFTSETGFTSESDSVAGTDWYTLQLNTNTFSTTVCLPTCTSATGWEQFIFANQGTGSLNGILLIEFWLINYGTCPAGWTTSSNNNCWKDSTHANYGYINPAYLSQYTLTGQASSTTDTSKICNTSTGNCFAQSGTDYLGLYNNNWWNTEYNVFGNNHQANFNTGFVLDVKINNFETGQSCGSVSYTAETNNLNYNAGTCQGGLSSQYITFRESD